MTSGAPTDAEARQCPLGSDGRQPHHLHEVLILLVQSFILFSEPIDSTGQLIDTSAAFPHQHFLHFSTTSPALSGRIRLLDLLDRLTLAAAYHHRSSFICRTTGRACALCTAVAVAERAWIRASGRKVFVRPEGYPQNSFGYRDAELPRKFCIASSLRTWTKSMSALPPKADID